MPEEGLQLSPKEDIMTAREIFLIASEFVKLGVKKIRLTGGEPLIRRDFEEIVRNLSLLPVELAITTNGILLDKYLPLFDEIGLDHINISLDTLDRDRFKALTRRDRFQTVMQNIENCRIWGIVPRLNVVLLKGQNEEEINNFIEMTRERQITVRFIEFMPFDGNHWDKKKLVSLLDVLEKASQAFGKGNLQRIQDAPHDTSKNYKIKGFKGSFSIISTVTNPFCDTCNRIRLTANGKLKNCLFSEDEADLLAPFRSGSPIDQVVKSALLKKHFQRGGMNTDAEFSDPNRNQHNRSMILIGG